MTNEIITAYDHPLMVLKWVSWKWKLMRLHSCHLSAKSFPLGQGFVRVLMISDWHCRWVLSGVVMFCVCRTSLTLKKRNTIFSVYILNAYISLYHITYLAFPYCFPTSRLAFFISATTQFSPSFWFLDIRQHRMKSSLWDIDVKHCRQDLIQRTFQC